MTRWAVDDGGVVTGPAAVAKLAGCIDRDGERYGESDADEGECDNGIVDSDTAFGEGRWTCEGGRGMARLGEAHTACGPMMYLDFSKPVVFVEVGCRER
jgi:hypothetical protein